MTAAKNTPDSSASLTEKLGSARVRPLASDAGTAKAAIAKAAATEQAPAKPATFFASIASNWADSNALNQPRVLLQSSLQPNTILMQSAQLQDIGQRSYSDPGLRKLSWLLRCTTRWRNSVTEESTAYE